MNGKSGVKWPPFPAKFHVLASENGARTILEEDGTETVTPVLEDRVVSEILLYCQDKLAKHKGFRFDHATAVKAMRYWLATTPPIPEPARLRELSEAGLCYRRLPFDSIDDAFEAPLFEELFSRCSNAKALVLFIGSLFYESANRQQYLYLYGSGGDGKGSLVRVLQKIFGEQFQAENSTLKPNQFWMSGLVGRRLVVFSETNNSKIVMSEMIKTITGDDPVRVERKGKDPFTTMLRCKLMIVSNQSPTVSSMAADQRRLILCEMTGTGKDPEMDYEERLWKEVPYLVGACRRSYMDHAAGNRLIPVNRDLADEAAAESEQHLSDLFEQNFLLDSNFSMSGSELCYILRTAGVKDNMQIKDFTSYLARAYNIRKMRKEKGMVYFGMRGKMSTERKAHITMARDDLL